MAVPLLSPEIGAKPLFLGQRIDVHSPAGAIEPDVAINQGKNCVVAPQPNVSARRKFRSALADNDVASNNELAAELFDPESLTNTIATVLDASLSFFVSHG
jgi:hypothetical protein